MNYGMPFVSILEKNDCVITSFNCIQYLYKLWHTLVFTHKNKSNEALDSYKDILPVIIYNSRLVLVYHKELVQKKPLVPDH